MMKSWKGICFYLGFVWFCGAVLTNRSAFSQSSPWSLEDCISYARQNNLNVRRSYLKTLVQEEDYLQSRSQLLPEVGFNTGQNFSYTNKSGTGVYSGTYDLSASWSLTCGKLLNDIKQKDLSRKIAQTDYLATQDEIMLSIVQAYVECLYAREALKTNEASLLLSDSLLKRAEKMFELGSISQVDLSLFSNQKANYRYQKVQAENALVKNKLALKQLLELKENMEIADMEVSEDYVMSPVLSTEYLYDKALNFVPQLVMAQQNSDLASLAMKSAKLSYLPTFRLSAGVNTGYNSSSSLSLSRQLESSFYENIGLNISIPIYSKRSNKTAVNTAKINMLQQENELEMVKKDIYKTIDELRLELVNYQSSLVAAKAGLEASEESYKLVSKQFDLGLKTTFELLSQSNDLFSAKQNLLQTKYQALIRILLLKYYGNEEVKL